MKTPLPMVALLIWTHLSFAQSWQRSFGGNEEEFANAIIQTSDGGFLTVGYTLSYGAGKKDAYIIKTDGYGAMIWQQVIGGAEDDIANDVVENSNGEFFIAGESRSSGNGGADIYLIKMGSDGQLLWTKTYGGTQDDEAQSIVCTNSGDLAMAGSTKSFGAGLKDVYLIKVDSAGNTITTKTYGLTSDDNAFGISLVHDGGFVIAGKTLSYGANYGYGIRTNAAGDTLWTKSFYLRTNSSGFQDVVELNTDSTFLFAGDGGDFWVNTATVKTDLSGTSSFTHFSSLLDDGANDVIATSDGGFATLGWQANYGVRISMIKYNINGVQEFQRDFQYGGGSGYSTSSLGYGICQTSNGGYCIAGMSYLGSSSAQIYLVRTDATGFYFQTYLPLSATGSTTFCEGDSVQLSAPPGYDSYQFWYYGQNHATYILSTSSDSTIYVKESGGYRCYMSDENGIYVTTSIGVSVYPIPTATVTPAGTLNFCDASTDTTLTATASGGATYQWSLNNSAIPGATLLTYQPLLSGNYTITVSNTCDTVTSSPTVVNANVPPVVTLNSQNSLTNVQGNLCGYATLTTQSIPGSTYQWYNWTSLLTNVVTNSTCETDTGKYYVIVTNGCGVDTTNSVSVTAGYVNFQIGSSGPTMGCGVDSVLLLAEWFLSSQQWYFNGNPIAGAYGDSYMATVSGTYSCSGNYNCAICYGGSFNYSVGNMVNVVINSTPLPSISANGPISMCAGSVDLSASVAGATYQWYNNANLISGATLQTYTVTSTGKYRCKITNAQCGMVYSNWIDVWYGLPTGNISTFDSIICPTQTSSLRVNNYSAGTIFQWQLNGNDISGATESTYYAGQGGNYYCILSNGCGADTTNAITVTLLTLPSNQLSPSGLIKICEGDSVTLSADSGYTYVWSRDYSTITGATGSQYTASISGRYKVWINNGSCNVVTFEDTVEVVPLPTNEIWPSTIPRFCGTDSVQLNGNTGVGYSYQWFQNSLLIPGAVQPTYFAQTSGDYSVQITNSLGCTDISPDFNVDGNYMNNIGINHSGFSTICIGDSVLLTPNQSGISYQWMFNNVVIPGATNQTYYADTAGVYSIYITNAQGCSGTSSVPIFNEIISTIYSASINESCGGNDGAINLVVSSNFYPLTFLWSNGSTTEDLSNLAAGNYSVTITNAIGCTRSYTDTVFETITPPSVVLTVYDSLICQGQTTTLTANNVAGITYQWELNGVPIPGATNYYYGANTPGIYDCVVSNNCGDSTSSTVTISLDSLSSASITSNVTAICAGDSAILTANTGSGYLYQWKESGTSIQGATSSTYVSTTGGNYTCTITTSCSTLISNTIIIEIHTLITASISTSDPLNICQGDSSVLQANTGNGISYQWQLDGLDITGETGSSFTADLSGTYTCLENNACFTDTSNAIIVTVNPLPTILIATGDTVFCTGDSISLYVSASSSNNWQWKLNGLDIPGANDSVYVASEGGIYTCTASDSCGSGLSNIITVVEDIVPAPSVTGTFFTRICFGDSITFSTPVVAGYTYQWYRYMIPIAGATNENYTVTITGSYRVQVFDSIGCHNISTVRFVMVGCAIGPPPPPPPGRLAESTETVFEAIVYPNPSQTSFTIELIGNKNNFSMNVYDIMGQGIDYYTGLSPEENFQFGENLSPGIYQIEIIQGNQRKNIRIIKD